MVKKLGAVVLLVVLLVPTAALFAAVSVLYDATFRGGTPLRDYARIWYEAGARVRLFDASGNAVVSIGEDVVSRLPLTLGASVNNTAWDVSGRQTMLGDARVRKVVSWDPGNLAVRLDRPAVLGDRGIVTAWKFADAVTGTVTFVWHVPSDMDIGATPSIALAWSSPVVDPGDGSKKCLWEIGYLWRSPGQDMTSSGEEVIGLALAPSTTANGLVISEIGSMDAPAGAERLLLVRISRPGADPLDTLRGVSWLSEASITYTANTLGGEP